MNPTQIYHEALKSTEKEREQENLEKAKIEQEKLMAWSNWMNHPQTQEFVRILQETQDDLVSTAMRNFQQSSSQNLLHEANTIDKILNSVMINGTYETPQ